MKRTILTLAAAWLCWLVPSISSAQQPFGPLKINQEIRVTDDTGAHLKGRVEAITADTLTVDGHVLRTDQIRQVERKGDRLWNGLAIGAAVGVFLPLLPTEACMNQSNAGCVVSGIETGALLGLAFDAIHRGYTTVYRAKASTPVVRVMPHIDPHVRGINITRSW